MELKARRVECGIRSVGPLRRPSGSCRSARISCETDTVPAMNRRCARPGCGHEADTTLSFVYAQQIVWLDDLSAEDHPANHDLCARHADRTQPPRGWQLSDRRRARTAARLRYAS